MNSYSYKFYTLTLATDSNNIYLISWGSVSSVRLSITQHVLIMCSTQHVLNS